MKKIPGEYYLHDDVVFLSRDLLGKYLFTFFEDTVTSGIISETEAYEGITDRASHAYGNRRTGRTEIMFSRGGVAYVYLCYGIHHLFNIVTNIEEIPHAILIRAIVPTTGIKKMKMRRKMINTAKNLTAGPGTVSQALGIKTLHTGTDLTGDTIWLADSGLHIPDEHVISGPRVGVDYAGEDASLPYRFRISDGFTRKLWLSGAE